MTFTYFKKTGEIHFEHNGIDDYDGDDGYEFDYEVDDIDVQMAIAEFIYEDYIVSTLPTNTEAQNVINKLWNFISDFDLLETFLNVYHDKLRNMFEQDALEMARE